MKNRFYFSVILGLLLCFFMISLIVCSDSSGSGSALQSSIDIYILLDQSASMMDGDRWTNSITALQTFLNSSFKDSVAVGLQYFPVPPTSAIPTVCSGDPGDPVCGLYGPCVLNVCSGSFSPNTSCDPEDYQVAEIDIADIGSVKQLIIDSLTAKSPIGEATPTQPALEGAVYYAKNRAQTYPDHKTIIIFISDGEPTGCTTNSIDGAAVSAAGAAAGSPPVKTYVIGLGSETTALNAIAASGGTDSAYMVDTTGDIHQQVLDYMNLISADAGQ